MVALADSWSLRISDRYRLELPEDLADWLDGELWRQSGCGEFRQPVDATILLEQTPDPIWPALMPPDFLPLVGNSAGDWLCLRVDANDRVSQIVHWYHGGGDWLPWGRTLAEAVVFDAIGPRLPGQRRRHAIPAENPRCDEPISHDPLLTWALRHSPPEITELLKSGLDGEMLATRLIETQTAEIAIRCELVQQALANPLADQLTRDWAEQAGIDWNDAIKWMFDLDRLPATLRQQLESELAVDLAPHQSWDTAAEHCRRVAELAPELAWPWEIAGYSHQRRGQLQVAKSLYASALSQSVFTDQSVRLQSHWTADRAAKFSAAMLNELQLNESDPSAQQADPQSEDQATRPALPIDPLFTERLSKQPVDTKYLDALCEPNLQTRRETVMRYWCDKADAAREQGRLQEVYENFVAAGWDLGAEPMTIYGELLEQISEAASLAGFAARAEVARTHRACLRDRYGI